MSKDLELNELDKFVQLIFEANKKKWQEFTAANTQANN